MVKNGVFDYNIMFNIMVRLVNHIKLKLCNKNLLSLRDCIEFELDIYDDR